MDYLHVPAHSATAPTPLEREQVNPVELCSIFPPSAQVARVARGRVLT
jgi:hypothetical protein